jgi:hypothetical protein
MTPGAAMAAFITIDDTAADDTITFTWGGFDVGDGFGVVGGPNATPAGSVTVPETGPVTFGGAWAPPSGSAFLLFRTIYLVEAADPSQISDILGLFLGSDGTNGLIQGQFQSDAETPLGTVPPGTSQDDIFVEDGQPVVLSYPSLTVTVLSDMEAASVAAPASLGLIGFGLGVIGWLRRRTCVVPGTAQT